MSTPPASRERLPTLRSELSGSGQGTSIAGAATGLGTSSTRRPTSPQDSSTPHPRPVQPSPSGEHRGWQHEQRPAVGNSASGATYSGRSAALRSPSWTSDVSPRPDAALQDWSNSELRRPTIARPPPLHVASHSVAERASFPPFYHHARAVRPEGPTSREPVAGTSRWPASGPHRDPRARSPVRDVAYSDVRYGSQPSREPFRNAARSASQVGFPTDRGAASSSSWDGHHSQASRERSGRDYLAPAPPPPPPSQAGESLSRSYDGPTRLLPAHRSTRLSGSPGLERAQGRSYGSFMPPPPSPSSRGSPFRPSQPSFFPRPLRPTAASQESGRLREDARAAESGLSRAQRRSRSPEPGPSRSRRRTSRASEATSGAVGDVSGSSGGAEDSGSRSFEATSASGSTTGARRHPPMPRPRNDQMSERRRRYALSIVQQPSTGCAFGTNLLSRISVSPPLILQLRVSEPDGAEVLPLDELPFMLCQLRLVTATGQPADMLSPVPSQLAAPDAEESGAAPSEPPRRPIPRAQQPSILQGSADGPAMEGSTPSPPRVPTSHSSSPAHAQNAAVPVRMLYGNMVAFGVRIPETQGQNNPHGIFFVFPDISIRSRGRFRLVADLNRMPNTSPAAVSSSDPTPRGPLASVQTQSFDVLLRTQYIAPRDTPLTEFFANHVSLPVQWRAATD